MELGLSHTTDLLTPPGGSGASGIYETFRIDAGSTPFLERHISRMFSGILTLGGQWSLNILDLTALVSRTLVADHRWAKRVRLDAKISPTNDVYLSITGFELTGYEPTLGAPPVSIMTRAADRDVDGSKRILKSSNNAENRILRADANAAAHFEGVFVSTEGQVYEGAFSNIFMIRNGGLKTPGIDLVLPGITRQVVMELAGADGMDIDDRGFTISELVKADEAFITSAIIGLVPVGTVEHEGVIHRIGYGEDHSATTRLSRLYQSLRTSETS